MSSDWCNPSIVLRIPTETRAKLIFALLLGLGIGGFLYLCVAASTCQCCYFEGCYGFPDFDNIYRVNSALCFAGGTTGSFFCFLSGWGAMLTIRRRSSIMGFGHFFGASCVTFLIAVQSAGLWSSQANILRYYVDHVVHSPCSDEVIAKPNMVLYRATKFLFDVALLISIDILILAPLYFLSRDVYEDSEASLHAVSRRRSSFAINSYQPDSVDAASSGSSADDERRYLGRTAILMRSIKPQYTRIPDTPADSPAGGPPFSAADGL